VPGTIGVYLTTIYSSLFFEANSSEVFNILLTEWNTEEAKKVWFEEGLEEGMRKIIELLKTGKSPDEIIRDYSV